MQKETFEVEYEYEGERLDKYVSILFPEQSRSFFQKLIKDGNVSVNDKVQKANYRLKTEDLVIKFGFGDRIKRNALTQALFNNCFS